jgi:hypothetical protein
MIFRMWWIFVTIFHNLKNKMSVAVCILSWFFYLWKFLLMMKIFVWIYSPHSVTAPLLFQWKRVRRKETIIVNIWDICWLLVGRDSVQLSIPYTILFWFCTFRMYGIRIFSKFDWWGGRFHISVHLCFCINILTLCTEQKRIVYGIVKCAESL